MGERVRLDRALLALAEIMKGILCDLLQYAFNLHTQTRMRARTRTHTHIHAHTHAHTFAYLWMLT